jgi:hypothetical protein
VISHADEHCDEETGRITVEIGLHTIPVHGGPSVWYAYVVVRGSNHSFRTLTFGSCNLITRFQCMHYDYARLFFAYTT